jgi:hypothetical protein
MHVDQDAPVERACVRGRVRGHNPILTCQNLKNISCLNARVDSAMSPKDRTTLLFGGAPLPSMARLILQGMGGFSSYGAKPSLRLLSLHFMYRNLETFCSVR